MSSTVVFNNKSPTNDNTKHLEIFSLIWLNNNDNIEDSLDAQQKLRVIINLFKEFQDAEECQQYIGQRSKQDQLILIVNDQLANEIIPSVHKLPQVLSIYIYRQDKKSNEQWNSKFAKVKAAVVEIDELVSRIKADLTSHIKKDEPLSMNMLATGKSATEINGHFVFSQVLVDCLLRLRSNGEDRNDLISCLRNEYEGNSSVLSKICEFENNYISNKALWWYTSDSFVYKTLNAALRKQDTHMILLYSSFISDIHRQLQYHQLKYPVRVYRSQLMSTDELVDLEQYIGQFISMNSFLSTSMERPVAIFYMGDPTNGTDLQRVLFEIEADPKVVATKPFADISTYSCFSMESEVLFMLGSIFRLNKITHGDDQVSVIQMTLCNDDEHDLKQVLGDMKDQNGIGETNFRTLGKVLWNMGKLDLAEKYYNRLIDELSSNDPELNILYAELSRIASQQGNYNKSVQLHGKSLEIRNQLLPTDIINKALQVGSSIDIDPIITRECIYQTAITLKETVEQVKANKNQCKRLGERVGAIILVLQCINGTDLRKAEIRKSLMDFCICLEQCLAFVTKFQGDKLWFLKIFNSINSKDQFEKMNAQLLQCTIDLNLGINLQRVFNCQQDELDQQNDLNAIQYKLDEIASMMVQQQQEQLRYVQNIEKDIRPRYSSYKHHLQQSITQANDPTKAKKLIDREHTFRCIPYYDLIQEERIGKGGFADVYRGRWLSQDHEVAIKIIRITSLDERVEEDFIKEISTMQRIRYEHVLNIYGACMEPTKYMLVVEYMSLGSLHDFLRQKTIQPTWPDRWSIALQMTKGINYLHTLSEPIIHRDIKSHNILMTKNDQGFLVKIGDLGLAKIRHETSQYFTQGPVVGTLSWKAPELLRMGKHTEASDVYALGIVFWELATNHEPYEYADDRAISEYVRRGDRMPIPADVPELFTKLISDAWAQEPKQRPTCQQLLDLLKKKYCEPDTVKEIKEKVDNSQASTPARNIITDSLPRQHPFPSADEQFETINLSNITTVSFGRQSPSNRFSDTDTNECTHLTSLLRETPVHDHNGDDNSTADSIDYLLPANNQRKLHKIIVTILIPLAVLTVLLTMGTIFTFFSTKKQQLPISIAYTRSTIAGVNITTAIPEITIMTDKFPTTVCAHRKFNTITDILYSFDCLNATDDILGMYNGIAAIPAWIPYNSEIAQSMLPSYVTPDYSGQGAAMKLDSSIKYQYIQLLRSPIFFNQTFTISVWLNPNVQPAAVYVILSQKYSTAPALAFNIINQYAVMRVYNTLLWSSTKLKNFEWQHVTFVFAQDDLSMAIRIDGLLNAAGGIGKPVYGNFEIEQTAIGSFDSFNQYNGLMDQLSIAFRVKSNIDVLDEATLVLRYNFEDDNSKNDFLFKDISVNSIRARGLYVSHQIGSRHDGQGTLSLNNPLLSYFQSGNFVLLSSHNYSYSYALWLNVFNCSSSMPLVHLVARSERSLLESNSSTCLAMLIMNRTDENNFQLSVYIYGSGNQSIIASTTSVAYSSWFHLVVMVKTNNFSLFVNGTLVASSIGTDTTTLKINNQQRLTLTVGNPERGPKSGDLYSSICNTDESRIRSNQSMIGVDDLRFYSRELKVKEIEALTKDDFVPSRFFFD